MDPQNMNQPPVEPQQPVQPPTPPIPEAPTPQPQPPFQPQPQPQPQSQPQSPLQPIAPAPAPGGFVPQPVGGGPNKKLIIGIISGVVGLLLIIIVAVLLVTSFSVSKKDYLAALDQYNDVSSANYTLSSKVSTLQYGLSSGTDTSFDNDVDAAKSAIGDLKKENEELGKLKAVKVGDGKEKYKAFNDKIETYTKYIDDLMTSLKDARRASTECDDTSTSASNVSQAKAVIATCVAALEKIKDTPNADIKEYMGKLKDQYEALSSIMTKLSAIKDPYGSQYDQYKALRDQMYDVLDKIRDARTDFSSNLEKHVKEVDPKEAADNLGDFLTEKASGNK